MESHLYIQRRGAFLKKELCGKPVPKANRCLWVRHPKQMEVILLLKEALTFLEEVYFDYFQPCFSYLCQENMSTTLYNHFY